MTAQTQALGAYGERVAATHLAAQGMRLIERNWRCSGGDVDGELDIVAREGDTLVFVEVKTRMSGSSVEAAAAVTPEKAARLKALAERWQQEHASVEPEGVRIDVVTVERPAKGAAIVHHLRGAV